MAFNQNFTVQIVIRTTLLLMSMVAFAWLLQYPHMRFNQLTVALLVVLQAGGLIWYVQKTNRALERFFLGIRHGDLTMTFQQPSGGRSFRALEASMQQVLEAYQQVKVEKEAQYRFLQMLVGQLPIGILTLAGDELVLMNQTAASLLQVDDTRDWKHLQAQHPHLTKALENLGDHGRTLVAPAQDAGTGHLAVAVSTTIILGKPHRLISLQDIRTEIEQQEIEAWHKLIRILTHEIMNSVTPIASLTETLQDMLTDAYGQPKPYTTVTADNLDDIRFSLNTIHKRSEGLLSFVDKYRTLSRIPRPAMGSIHLPTFFDHLSNLLTPDLQRQGITLTTTADDTALTIAGDAALIEQVIINLVSNSTYALQATQQKQISLRAYAGDRHTILEVTDNGKGIPPKEINDIFIPFFSTRKEGMGIGLSLSKQIMSLHGGTIRVQSVPGQGASFQLYFKKQS
ncbi:sensor histidine kinase [Dawidia soli]|uniref:histidine kinase n=1 Tax=Dawidia soli TaxID=2782352 RepID=A0AAP2D979_9BACT|nr:ATP-binding protein [Dawidia soli]MBT1687808.1 ATP-binding protein [Dawidia soli]